MFASHQWRSRTATVLALGVVVGTAVPFVIVTPAPAQRISQYSTARIPAGTIIAVDYEKDKIIVTPDETAPLTLKVARDIRSSQGTILIPAGSDIKGQLQPARRGSQFVAQQLIIGRKRYRLDANSKVVTRTESIQRGANTGSIVQGAAIGAAAAAALAGITGDKAIATEEILGGAGIGAIGGILLGRRKVDVVVVRPQQDLALRVQSDIVLR